MKRIELTKGQHALVDDDDFERVNRFNWHAIETVPGLYYAARTVRNPVSKKKKMVLMHRFILKAPKRFDIDHENRNRLDNQKSNIRLATRSQNLAAKPTLGTWKGKPKTSKFRGVSWNPSIKRWTSQISIEGKKKHLGCFLNPQEAAWAYDEAAKIQFGDFAQLNFP